jgi:hypothetical protein
MPAIWGHASRVKKPAAIILLIAWVFSYGCQDSKSEIQRSFYHWKTTFSPTEYERWALKTLHVNRLYIKYFDVDWPEHERQAVPVGKVQFAALPESEVIPTVFITTRAIRKSGDSGSTELADRIHQLVLRLHPDGLPAPREIQIDCDWTQGTRSAYFALLRRLRQRLDRTGTRLSATIRLHQLKYAKLTGIPPVHRGVLMFYNMGDLDDPEETNSILSVPEGSRYLYDALDYELPLDAALPIFAWGVLIRRDTPIALLHNLREETARNVPWFRFAEPRLIHVDSSHYFSGRYLQRGDRIRLEQVDSKELMSAAKLIDDRLRVEHRSLILYQLDSTALSSYRISLLDSVYSRLED